LTEAAELVSIAYELKLFSEDDVPYTQVQTIKWIEQHWNIDLKHYRNLDINSRGRKSTLPSLIKKMLAAYNIRTDRLEEERRKKR
jgi:hypothetical protein